MRLVLFTKNHNLYLPFIRECINKFDKILIVVSDRNVSEIQGIRCIFHSFKKDKEYPQFIKHVKNFHADILVSFYYNRIIKDEILSIANLAVNFHGSLLPNYAGAHAINWQIINGEKISGVTIHELTSTVDGGRIISQDSFKIKFQDTSENVLKSGIDCSVGLLAQFISDYKLGLIKLQQQKRVGNEFICRKRKPEDGEITKDMDQLSAYNMIRALAHPWPGAFYFNDNDKKIVINKIISFDECGEILRNKVKRHGT